MNQTRQQAENLFKQEYTLQPKQTYEVNEYKLVKSYSVTEDGNLLVNGSYQ
ncbi:hypothetical protein [Spirosoma pollinicola]|uniref:hypothetical protein n=1 Tax=Spirosoma pollinicola TaxID=2057025 RepID=UPI0012FD0132|nr:hypothetical protein [Spirosoma pollinicola]